MGDHSLGGSYVTYPGTWRGTNGTCSYVFDGQLKNLNPGQPGGSNIIVEVLSGLDIGQANSTGSWRSSSGGVPVDAAGQNAHPPNPRFAAFLAGGDATHPAFYLCRVKGSLDKQWRYGYQGISSGCLTDAGTSVTGSPEVLVFKTVKNTDTGN